MQQVTTEAGTQTRTLEFKTCGCKLSQSRPHGHFFLHGKKLPVLVISQKVGREIVDGFPFKEALGRELPLLEQELHTLPERAERDIEVMMTSMLRDLEEMTLDIEIAQVAPGVIAIGIGRRTDAEEAETPLGPQGN